MEAICTSESQPGCRKRDKMHIVLCNLTLSRAKIVQFTQQTQEMYNYG